MKLDLNKPLRHKETKKEAKIVFIDNDTKTNKKYLVIAKESYGWLTMSNDGITEVGDEPWMSLQAINEHLENIPEKRKSLFEKVGVLAEVYNENELVEKFELFRCGGNQFFWFGLPEGEQATMFLAEDCLTISEAEEYLDKEMIQYDHRVEFHVIDDGETQE